MTLNCAVHTYASPQKSDTDLIENAIIINGLSMEADSAPAEVEPRAGQIIYDDNFQLKELSGDIEKRQKKQRTAKKQPAMHADERLINKLKASDPRWHITIYKVRRGDNLFTISKSFSTETRYIIEANKITGPDKIKEGIELLVPNRNGIMYSIKRGDSISLISKKYNVSPERLYAQNGLSGNDIYAGEHIFIPDARNKQIAASHKPKLTRIAVVKNTAVDSGQALKDAAVKQKVSVVSLPPVKKPADITAEQIAVNEYPEKDMAAPPENDVEHDVLKNTEAPVFVYPLYGKITSGYGMRRDPFSRTKKFHCGLDLSVVTGTMVKASADGEVIYAGWKDGYGKMVVIRHANGYFTIYAHLSDAKVEKGSQVKSGDVIALSGSTGAVTGPHLHFEVRKYLTPLNPMRFLR